MAEDVQLDLCFDADSGGADSGGADSGGADSGGCETVAVAGLEAVPWWELPLADDSDQLVMDFSNPNDAGFVAWQEEREKRIQRLRRVYGLPLLRQVSVEVTGIKQVLRGRLTLQDKPDLLTTKRSEVRLCVAGHYFTNHDIISICVEDTEA